jgi:hypothetical protein
MIFITSGIKINIQAGENENEMQESWQTIPYKYKKIFRENQVFMVLKFIAAITTGLPCSFIDDEGNPFLLFCCNLVIIATSR